MSRAGVKHALVLLGMACIIAAPSLARNAAPANTTMTLASAADDARAELQRIEQSITLSNERTEKLRAEMEKLKTDPPRRTPH